MRQRANHGFAAVLLIFLTVFPAASVVAQDGELVALRSESQVRLVIGIERLFGLSYDNTDEVTVETGISAEGLPPGVTMRKDGSLEAVPAATGVYPVRIAAPNQHGVAVLEVTVVVEPGKPVLLHSRRDITLAPGVRQVVSLQLEGTDSLTKATGIAAEGFPPGVVINEYGSIDATPVQEGHYAVCISVPNYQGVYEFELSFLVKESYRSRKDLGGSQSTNPVVGYGDGIFVATDRDGRFHRSPDGITWTAGQGPLATAYDIVFEAGTFFAPVAGGLLKSADGESWEDVPGPFPQRFAFTTFGKVGNRYLIGGGGGPQSYAEFHYSFDLVEWFRGQPDVLSIQGLALGNGVAVLGSADPVAYVSSDPNGAFWEDAATGLWEGRAIAFGKGLFVSAGFGGDESSIWVSEDGRAWESAGGVRGVTLLDLTFSSDAGGEFLACGTGGVMLSSRDGRIWVDRSRAKLRELAFTHVAYGEGRYVLGSSIGAVFAIDSDWEPTMLAPGEGALIGRVGTPYELQLEATDSPDGFYAVGLPSGLEIDQVTGIIHGVPQVAGVSTAYVTAQNGSGFSDQRELTFDILPESGLPPVIERVEPLGLEGSPVSVSLSVANSDVSTQISARGLPRGLSIDPSRVAIEGIPLESGKFDVTLAATNAYGSTEIEVELWVFPNPWQIVSLPGEVSAIGYGAGRFVAGGSEHFFVSDDATDWAQHPNVLEFGSKPVDICYGNGIFVTVTESGHLYSSADGTDWTFRREMGVEFGVLLKHRLVFAEGRFVLAAGDRTLSSTDGLEWGDGVSGDDFAATSVLAGEGAFVAAGHRTISRSDDGIHWGAITESPLWEPVLGAYGNGIFLLASPHMQELARSTDGGETWLMVDSPAERPTAMLFGNGQFLIVEGTNLRYTSTDGLNWRPLHFTGDGTFSLFFEMGVFGGDEFVLGALDYRILLKTRGGGRELLFGGAGRKDLALFHRNDGEWVYGFLLPQDYPIDGFEVLHHTNSLSPEDTLREIPEIIRSFHGSPDGAWNLWGVRVSDFVPYDRGILRVSGP